MAPDKINKFFLSVKKKWMKYDRCSVHSEVFGVKSMSSSWGRRHLYHCRIKMDFDFDHIVGKS